MGDLRQKPMRQKSEKAVERDKRLAATKRQVLQRSGGRCEGCGDREAALDLAHVAGRGHLLRADLADTPEMTMALCRDCHQKVDRHLDGELREKVRMAAYHRVWTHVTDPEWRPALDALDMLRFHAERNAG